MRNILFALIAITAISAQASAQTFDSNPLEINGSMLLDDRVRPESGKLNWQEYRMSLRPVYKVNSSARLCADIWVRKLITASPFDKPIENVQLREVYIDLYGFLSDNIDIRIGRQRIAWGTADRLNPSDNINPWELEDFWDFGRHTPTNSLLAKYYLNGFTLSAIFTPQFSSSLLPDQSWHAAFNPTIPKLWPIMLPGGVPAKLKLDPLTITRTENYPNQNLNAATYAVKIAQDIRNYNVSIGWVRNHSPLPTLTNMSADGKIDNIPITFDNPIPMSTNVNATLTHTLRNIVSADFSGAIGSVGIWGEAAMFIPEKTTLNRSITIVSPLGTMIYNIGDTTIFDGKPYLKYVLGFDYTFPANIYLNVQYLHGFFHEEGKENLTDWLAWGCDWRSTNDKLRISPINGAFKISDLDKISSRYSFFWTPELSYKPSDNVEILAGSHYIFAGKEAQFYAIKDNSEAYLKVKFSF